MERRPYFIFRASLKDDGRVCVRVRGAGSTRLLETSAMLGALLAEIRMIVRQIDENCLQPGAFAAAVEHAVQDLDLTAAADSVDSMTMTFVSPREQP